MVFVAFDFYGIIKVLIKHTPLTAIYSLFDISMVFKLG